ncbi:DNA methylase [Mycobacterium phage Seabastian]|uniref:DNA methyltransferase n=1 Tax=Mycobacterium phage Llama TaxID=1541823 RepID=UPI0004F5D508|nr:DNA methyltransferase [Mycobacterium phage Llama]AIM51017.1 DNA methylase [Mycobacterium phage Llama]QOP67159.1 DNA methylase [Mycobacterium phage Seabastian]QOP67270.1 DNA methylase [Mycobacterium phage OfUltron]
MFEVVDTVLADLHESGFNAEWSVLSACAMGAPHTRERLFILAYPNNQRLQASGKSRVRDDFEMAFRGVGTEHVHAVAQPDSSQRGAHWASEPGVDRMADGISAELDRRRLFALGNAVVPQISEHIGRMILEATA